MRHFIFTLLLALSFTFSALRAQIGGSSVFPSLDLPLSARAAALGGKVCGINDNDINLATWNPALLNSSMHSQLAMSFSDYLSDVKYGYAGFAWHFNKIGTFALFGTRIDYGNFRETDIYGNIVGTFSAGEYGLNLGYSRQLVKLDSNFSVGGTIKFIQSDLFLWKASGLAVDLGANYFLAKHNFSASLLIRNYGRMLTTYTPGNHEKLPFEMEAGLAFKPKHMPFRFSLTWQDLQQWDLTYTDPNNPPQTVDPLTGDSIKTSKFKVFGDKMMRHVIPGGELLIGKAVSIRLGYNYQRRKELMLDTRHGAVGFCFGLGIHIYKFNFSYAHAQYHLAGNTNTFTLMFSLSDFIHAVQLP